MQDPTYPLFTVFSFFGFFLGLLPLQWHFQAWNAGTCAYMLWTSFACLVQFINSIVWRDSALNLAPVWCDITSKFLLGASVGIPASSLCISRRLYTITSVQTVSVTREDKIRGLIVDACISAGLPCLVMILHVVVQGHRFDIYENIGCYPVIYNTIPAYPLVMLWPVLLGSISFIYSALTLRAFWKRRLQMNEFLSSSSSLNTSRYLRLMILALTEMTCTLPLGIYNIHLGTAGSQVEPWVSWEDTHFDFFRVDLIPAIVWRSNPASRTALEFTRWLFPACALLFFALFGLADEAQKKYALLFWCVAQRLGFRPPPRFDSITPWNKNMGPSSTVSKPPPAYTSVSPSKPRRRPDSLTSSLADSCMDVDIEKCADSSSASTLSSCQSFPAIPPPVPVASPSEASPPVVHSSTSTPAAVSAVSAECHMSSPPSGPNPLAPANSVDDPDIAPCSRRNSATSAPYTLATVPSLPWMGLQLNLPSPTILAAVLSTKKRTETSTSRFSSKWWE